MWVAVMLVAFLPLVLGALTDSDDLVEVVRTSIAVALAGLVVVVADTARVMRKVIRSSLHLTDGRHVGISVDAAISSSKGERKVDVFASDSKEPFISFVAWDPPDQPTSRPTEERFAAVLYGELCKGGGRRWPPME